MVKFVVNYAGLDTIYTAVREALRAEGVELADKELDTFAEAHVAKAVVAAIERAVEKGDAVAVRS